MDGGQNVWVAGRLQRLEGPMALVHFHEIDSNGIYVRIYLFSVQLQHIMS